MKKLIAVFVLTATTITLLSSSNDYVKKTNGYVEENDLWIPASAKSKSTMTEAKFNEILDRVEKIYAPIVRNERRRLVIQRKWDDGTVNAYASQRFRRMYITMFGGLARHPAVTADGFTLVACHEMAHHLGGQPRMTSRLGRWASVEGQADYWASLKCMRKFMEEDDNVALMANVDVPAFAVEKCEASFSNAEEVAICKRNTMAGISLASLLQELSGTREPIALDTPDQTIVEETRELHPEAQCRLDSYFAGSLCDIDAYTDTDPNDVTVGVCTRLEGYTIEARPLCWYKPAE